MNPRSETEVAYSVPRPCHAFTGQFPSSDELQLWPTDLEAGRQTMDDLVDRLAATEKLVILVEGLGALSE